MSNCFISIDVETADTSRASICQIGLAAYLGCSKQWEWSSLVDPEEAFDTTNMRIHGLKSEDVQGAPKFPAVLAAIADSLRGQIVASHTPFDSQAIAAVSRKYSLELPPIRWIDTCSVARFAWPDLESHALDSLCRHLAIDVDHHDAVSDAVACGAILARAVAVTAMEIDKLIEQAGAYSATDLQPSISGRTRKYSERLEMCGRSDGPFAGHVLVCTGEFSIGEARLVEIAANLGCDVEDRFSKRRTTMLVVGIRDPAQFNGKDKSRKQLDAEAAIAAGRSVTILTESEFLTLAAEHQVV